MAVSQERISKYSLADLKNTSDDAIPAYLNSLSFKQSHTLSDVRLVLGYTAFILCALTFWWDYKLGFDSTKYYTAIAVAIYTALNGALTFWIWGVEKGIIYVGVNEEGEKLEITTSTTKHVPRYEVTASTYTKANPSKPSKTNISKPFAEWFDEAGQFVVLPFQEMLASNVQVIGRADPKKVDGAKNQKDKVAKLVDDGTSMDTKWASLLAESSGMDALDAAAATTATPEKSTKKRGRKS